MTEERIDELANGLAEQLASETASEEEWTDALEQAIAILEIGLQAARGH